MTVPERESISAEALLTDLYLNALLAGSPLDSVESHGPAWSGAQVDAATRRTAARLRRDLIRIHPSFRFEERLASRLAEVAVAMRIPVAVGDDRVVPFPIIPAATFEADSLPGQGRHERTRPLLIGGALTSAALSLAGAAFVAWRFGRAGRAATPMARAARTVRLHPRRFH